MSSTLAIALVLFTCGIVAMVCGCYNNPWLSNKYNIGIDRETLDADWLLISSIINVLVLWWLTWLTFMRAKRASNEIKCLLWFVTGMVTYCVGMRLFQEVFKDIYLRLF